MNDGLGSGAEVVFFFFENQAESILSMSVSILTTRVECISDWKETPLKRNGTEDVERKYRTRAERF